MQSKMIWIAGSFILAPILGVLEKYFFSDWEYLKFLVALIAGDTFLGFYKAWKRGEIKSSAFYQVIEKLLAYMSLLIVLHILANFTISGHSYGAFIWVKTLGYSALIVRESISIIENIGAVNRNILPSWILKKLKDFDRNGKFKDE